MKALRRLFASVFGLRGYLQMVSRTYIFLTNCGFLRKQYPELYFIDKLVQPTWTCIDIGANLGYYSNRIGRNLKGGRLLAVEPVPLFAQIWANNTKGLRCRMELLQMALGDENKQVTMSIPVRDGVVRHGLTKIDDDSSAQERKALTFTVELRKSEEAFGDLENVHFIKIDVEGYEQHILSSMQALLARNRPVLQVELTGQENRARSLALLHQLGYGTYKLAQGRLVASAEGEWPLLAQDFYFIHPANPLFTGKGN
jgi:FkbM family methyltransferase